MIGAIVTIPILMAPEIAEAVADGTATLVSLAGQHLLKGIVTELGTAETQEAIGETVAGIMASALRAL